MEAYFAYFMYTYHAHKFFKRVLPHWEMRAEFAAGAIGFTMFMSLIYLITH